MAAMELITGLVTPLFSSIEKMTTSDQERLTLQNQLITIQVQLAQSAMDYEKTIMQMQASAITAEAQGKSWLQASWRPITMLTFLALVVLDSFGLLANPLSQAAWDLLQLGLGGYVVGRSVEKTAANVFDLIRKKP